MLDLRELASEWRELVQEMSGNVPNTEGMSLGELSDATERFLAQPEQAEQVEKYVELARELTANVDVGPDDLEWAADNYGVTLIPESGFQDYARELAEDIGAIDPQAGWPLHCIDWERAANELATDYTLIEYDGDSYYYRL
jgi:hypothetical protein